MNDKNKTLKGLKKQINCRTFDRAKPTSDNFVLSKTMKRTPNIKKIVYSEKKWANLSEGQKRILSAESIGLKGKWNRDYFLYNDFNLFENPYFDSEQDWKPEVNNDQASFLAAQLDIRLSIKYEKHNEIPNNTWVNVYTTATTDLVLFGNILRLEYTHHSVDEPFYESAIFHCAIMVALEKRKRLKNGQL